MLEQQPRKKYPFDMTRWRWVALIGLWPLMVAAIPANLQDREYQKFLECPGTGVPCVTVQGNASGTPIPVSVGGSSAIDTAVSLVASGTYTTSQTSADQTNTNFRRLILIVNVTSAGTGSVTPMLQVKDSLSATYVTVASATTAITANGTYVYYFADGASQGAWTQTFAFGLPGVTWRVVITANNANAMTYSASGQLLL